MCIGLVVFILIGKYQYVYSDKNYLFCLLLHEKNLYFYQKQNSSHFKNEFNKIKSKSKILRNNNINIMYPNKNYLLCLSIGEKINLLFYHNSCCVW